MATEPQLTDDLFGVRDKHVVVTGGARGVGKAIAAGLAKAGADVTVTSRTAASCEEAAVEIKQFGNCRGVAADLVTAAGRRALVEAVRDHTDHVDVLVNNAGFQWEQAVDDFPEEGWDDVYDVNIKAPFFLVQAFLPLLRAAATEDDPARVVNIGSINGIHVPSRDQFAYASSKAAVHHLTRHLAAKLAPSITVNAIAVGLFETGMKSGVGAAERDPAFLEGVPLRRFGKASDMAGTAIYLASAAGSYVTGSVIAIDGGAATTL